MAEHCNLHFWRHGPGYRGYHYGEIHPNVEYCIFKPDVMVLTNGIWHTQELLEAMLVAAKPTASDSSSLTGSVDASTSASSSSSALTNSSLLSLIANWSDWREKLKSAIQVRAGWESDGTQENYRACGLGDAVEIDHTAATVDFPVNPATGTSYRTFGVDGSKRDFPAMKSVVEWSRKEKQYFLHAWHQLDHVRRELFGAGAICRFHLYNNGVNSDFPAPPTERYADALQPVAFLLPWPTDGGVGDVRYSMGGPPRWNSYQRGIITSSIFHSFTSSQPVASSQPSSHRSPIFNPATSSNSPNDMFDYSVAGLSSVVRGCTWPLDCTDYSSNSTTESMIVARRILKLLGVSQQLAESIFIYYQSYCAGPRPIGREDPDRSISSSEPREEMFGVDGALCRWPITRLFANLHGVGTHGAAAPLSSLLTSSFMFSFGSEHLVPWPIILVAPIAPGWIGGFMAAANSFE